MKLNNYNTKDLIKIIKARKKKDYKFLLIQSIELLNSYVVYLQNQKNFDFDESYADFMSCADTNECDDLLREVK